MPSSESPSLDDITSSPAKPQRVPSAVPTSRRVTGVGASTSHVTVSATVGVDGSGCGTAVAVPCRSLSYALQSALQIDGNAAVVATLAPGRYDAGSCGLSVDVPLTIVGSGSANTVVDCGGRSRFLVTNESLVLSGFTITNGYAAIVGSTSLWCGGVVERGVRSWRCRHTLSTLPFLFLKF